MRRQEKIVNKVLSRVLYERNQINPLDLTTNDVTEKCAAR